MFCVQGRKIKSFQSVWILISRHKTKESCTRHLILQHLSERCGDNQSSPAGLRGRRVVGKGKREGRKDTQEVPAWFGALEPSWIGKQLQDLKIPFPEREAAQRTMLWSIIHGLNSCSALHGTFLKSQSGVGCFHILHSPWNFAWMTSKFQPNPLQKIQISQRYREFTLGLGVGFFLN